MEVQEVPCDANSPLPYGFPMNLVTHEAVHHGSPVEERCTCVKTSVVASVEVWIT